MKFYRSLLLGSAAVLAAAAGAQAADLPSMKAAPVDYVRVCSVYGAGFFYVPGTDTCLRLGGYVRAEFQYTPGQKIINVANGTVSQVASDQDQTGMEMRGRVDLDARTTTEWGTAQTVVQLRGTNTDGIRNSSATTNFGSGYAPAGNGSSSLTMERAFIRFAGFTAGVAPENFVAAPGYMYFGVPWAKFSNGIKELSYTATFAGGFSATLAIESRGDMPFNSVAGVSPAPSAVPTASPSTYVNQPDTGYDLVGNVRLDQPWGFAQLSGAIGNNSTSTAPLAANNLLLGPQTYGAWAIGTTIRVNLPMIAPGDQAYFIAAYGHGMDGLIMDGGTSGAGGTSSLSDSDNKRFLGGVLRNDSNIFPTTVTAAGVPTGYGTEDAYQIGGMLTHYWAPNWRSNFIAGYIRLEPPTATAANAAAGLNTQLGDADIYQAAGNLIWSPTANFDIGLELAYAHIKQAIQNPSAAFVAAGEPGLSENNWGTKLRLERQF